MKSAQLWIGVGVVTLIGLVLAIRRKRRKPMGPIRSVTRLANIESANLENALRLLGDTYDLVTELEGLYDRLPDLCQFPNDVDTNDSTFAAGLNGHLVWMCRRQLTLGILTLLRGHRGDSWLHLRKALETCAYAAKMGKHPHMARVWIQAGNDEKAFEKFREKFIKIFPDEDPRLKKMGEHFDRCSKAMHSSIYGMAAYFAAHVSKGSPSGAGLDIFDVRSNAISVGEFMVTVDIYLVMLRVFEGLLKPYAGDRLKDWTEQLTALEVKFRDKHKHWTPVVTQA
jgi:hypothetical protein